MKVAGSTLSFSKQPLREALEKLAQLGFAFVDIGAIEGWAHLKPSEMAAQPEAVAKELKRLCHEFQLTPVAFNAGLGADAPVEQQRRLRGLCQVAQILGIPVITLGTTPRGTPLEKEVQRWRRLTKVAKEFGITLSFEPHFSQIAENPKIALALVEQVPGLRITLDPSHFAIQGLRLNDYRFLLPYVTHVHLRDAGKKGWEEVQVPMGSGVVEFAAIVQALKEIGYEGALSCEYIDTVGNLDIAAELQKLKALLLSLMANDASVRYHSGGETL